MLKDNATLTLTAAQIAGLVEGLKARLPELAPLKNVTVVACSIELAATLALPFIGDVDTDIAIGLAESG